MRRLSVLFGYLAMCVAPLWAEDGKSDAPKPELKPAPGAIGVWGGGISAAKWYVDSIDKIVPLSDEQKQAMTDIITARDKAIADWQKESAEGLQAAQKAMMAAYQSKDQDAIARSQKEYQALSAPMQEIWKKHQPESVLTPEQGKKLKDSRLMTMIQASTAPVVLSDDQIQEIKAALARENLNEVRSFSYEAIQMVLTPEQKVTIAKSRALGYAKGIYLRAKLTDEQLKQVEGVCEELAKDPSIKPQDLYIKIKEKADGFLTAEQKEAMKAPWVGGFGGGGGILINAGQPQRTETPAPAKPEKAEPQSGSPRAQIVPGGGFRVIIGEGQLESPQGNPTKGEASPKSAQLLPGQPLPGQRVIQLPGGGIQVILGEGADHAARSHQMQLQNPQQMLANVKTQLQERIKHQSKIVRKSRQLLEELDDANGNPAKTQEIIQQLSGLQEELRQSNPGPGPGPGQPPPSLHGGGMGMPGSMVRPATNPAPGTPANQPDPAMREILNQLQRLRQELEELKKQR